MKRLPPAAYENMPRYSAAMLDEAASNPASPKRLRLIQGVLFDLIGATAAQIARWDVWQCSRCALQ